jgi:hypothetical protein
MDVVVNDSVLFVNESVVVDNRHDEYDDEHDDDKDEYDEYDEYDEELSLLLRSLWIEKEGEGDEYFWNGDDNENDLSSIMSDMGLLDEIDFETNFDFPSVTNDDNNNNDENDENENENENDERVIEYTQLDTSLHPQLLQPPHRVNTAATATFSPYYTTTTATENVFTWCTFLRFEYHMTLPASGMILLHSIVMIVLYEFVLDCIRLLYTVDVRRHFIVLYSMLYDPIHFVTTRAVSSHILHDTYQSFISLWMNTNTITITPCSTSNATMTSTMAGNVISGHSINVTTLPAFLSVPLTVGRSIALSVHVLYNYIADYYHYYSDTYYYYCYDTFFYTVLFVGGLSLLHISGYLYWWSSDINYTLLKLDTHNRIRLLQQQQQAQKQYHQHYQNPQKTSTPVTTNNAIDETYSPDPIMDPNHSSNNHINTFVRRLHVVRRYPMLRFTVYVMGYYTIYMLSQVLIATLYPYVSQHASILPLLPSATTFDKQQYVPIPEQQQASSSLFVSHSHPNNRNSFPCVVQNCQSEIIRQQAANMELLHLERTYTQKRLAKMSYFGYWGTWVYQLGDKTVYPLFYTFANQHRVDNSNEDDGDDNEVEKEEEEEDTVAIPHAIEMEEYHSNSSQPLRIRRTKFTMVDFRYSPVFNHYGELMFAAVTIGIGIVLLQGYGFIFWHKY